MRITTAVIEVVNLGLETDPLHPDLLLAKAEALQKLKHLKEGQACVLAVLKNNPKDNSRAQRLKKALEARSSIRTSKKARPAQQG